MSGRRDGRRAQPSCRHHLWPGWPQDCEPRQCGGVRRRCRLHSAVRAKEGRAARVMARVSPRRHRCGCGAAPHVGRDGSETGTYRDRRRAESRVRKAFCHARPPPRLLAPQASSGMK
eukprot:946592-Prymnesium_polylepis.1